MVRASIVLLFFLPALMAFIFAGCAISSPARDGFNVGRSMR